MLPLPGQEHNNWDCCINTGIFSLPTHLISTKPPSHNWKCCFLPWGPVSACSNSRHGPALGSVWPCFPSPGLIPILPAVMIPWRCLMRLGLLLTHYRWWTALPSVPKCCCYTWWTLQQLQGAQILFAGHSCSKQLLSGALTPFSVPWAIAPCHSLSILSKLGGILKPLGACNGQSQRERTLGVTMPRDGQHIPNPRLLFPVILLLPFNKMFGRK